MATDEYTVDPERSAAGNTCGVFIRAKLKGKWGSHDVLTLDRESLERWLATFGSAKSVPMRVVLILMGHRQ